MAKVNTKIDYDKEEDTLFLSKGRKVKASIDIGDFIIDVDMNGFITGIEILNASENLKLSEKQLASLQEASMVVTYKPNYVIIYLVMKFKEKEKDLTIPLTVDLGHGSVRTEKANFAVA
ncbi:hypothetical protein CMO93_04395 [Candidatus Woesearchaeota archaeon]|jgi:uncharacterized protein YuzE|nr:hypothetical protein [Candidatus Woesearchaeota archaeon]|tara:strand:+ start:469 stop:825 length:357 start_codon:yes stop_codon:yes gene_type:complete